MAATYCRWGAECAEVYGLYSVQAIIDPKGMLTQQSPASLSIEDVAKALWDACSWPARLEQQQSGPVNVVNCFLQDFAVELSR